MFSVGDRAVDAPVVVASEGRPVRVVLGRVPVEPHDVLEVHLPTADRRFVSAPNYDGSSILVVTEIGALMRRGQKRKMKNYLLAKSALTQPRTSPSNFGSNL